jgi:hypothetical protein
MKFYPFHCLKVYPVMGFSLALFLGILSPQFSAAQPESYTTPKVTLFIFEEKKVCLPSGYKSYNRKEKEYEATTCHPRLEITDVERMEELCTKSDCKLPSPTPPITKVKLKLGPLFPTVSAYCNENPAEKPLQDRKSMVVLFDWATPPNASITFMRLGNGSIPDMKWDGSLMNENRWFNHQRLDAFYPVNNIRWMLQVGEGLWEFSIER